MSAINPKFTKDLNAIMGKCGYIYISFYFTVFFILTLSLSCKGKNSTLENSEIINSDILKSHVSSDKLVIVTCIRCGCFIDALNGLPESEMNYFSQYSILTDTNCNKLKMPAIHIDKLTIDSISTDIYNITLIKRENGLYKSRIIQLNESSKIVDIMKEYF
ncbi:MAG: hypothetical protein J0M10_03630 [Chitinophagales bacterium]|nr:hypothetical protein [Chitinophagales bacterium]